jgi:hypothetical protein
MDPEPLKAEIETTRIRVNWRDILLLGLLVVFLSILFKDIILYGQRLIGDDFIAFYLGMRKFLYQEVWKNHSIPYWNPYLFGGIPFWAHFESAIFYPLGFLFWVFPPERAYGYTIFLHFILAGVFMYVLARSFSIGRLGSFIASTAFTCNGFNMALLYLGHLTPLQSYVWLPMVIFFLNRALASPKPQLGAIMAGAFWGVQILAGFPQDAFYTFIASMLFLLCSYGVRSSGKKAILNLSSVAALLFLTGAAIAAIQVIPAFEFVSESVRTSLDSYDIVTSASYPPEGIITAIIPHFFGNYADGTFWVSNVPWSIHQVNFYVGVLPLFLLFFISFRRLETKRTILFALILATLAMVLSMGKHTPIYKLAYLVPGFNRIRTPFRIIVLWVFALSILAGIGMDDLFHIKQNRFSLGEIVCVTVMIALMILVPLFYLRRSFVLDFFSPFILKEAIHSKMNDAVEIIYQGFLRLSVIACLSITGILLLKKGILPAKPTGAALCLLLLADLGYTHVHSIRYDERIYAAIEKIKQDLKSTIGKDKTLYRVGSYKFWLGPNLEMLLGYQTVGGFTALFPARYYEYINEYSEHSLPEGWQNFQYGVSPRHIFMDLLNVKYGLDHAQDTYDVRTTFLPRAFVVPQARIMKKEDVLTHLKENDFDPTQVVLIDNERLPSGIQKASLERGRSRGSARIVSYAPDRITVQTETAFPGYLFLSEMFYPGWKAFIDGKQKEILRGDYLFRVLELPEGQHRITMVFDPWSIKLGIGITVLTLFLLLDVAVYANRKRFFRHL